jgi:uncharacterized protein (TIGR02231 family)
MKISIQTIVMSFLTAFVVSFSSFATSTVHANDVQATSEVDNVIVYQNRATITRAVNVDLKTGENTLIISDLPARLISDSFRFEAKSKTPVTIGTLTHKRVNKSILTSERERTLQQKLQKLEGDKSLLHAEAQALDAQKDFLSSLSAQASAKIKEANAELKINSSDWNQAASTIHQGMKEILTKNVKNQQQIRSVNEEIEAVKAELRQLQTGAKMTYQVSVKIFAPQETNLTGHLSYQTNGVSWSPQYDARLDTSNGSMTLTQFGAVHQNTGEDWSNIALTLSTAQPARNATLDELYPKWVDIYNPEEMQNFIGRTESLAMPQAAQMRVRADSAGAGVSADFAPAPIMEKASYQEVSAEIKGLTLEYKINGRVDVQSDGSENKIRMTDVDLETSLHRLIRPQIDPNAFLTVKMQLPEDTTLLSGQVNLYRDGAFIGRGFLPMLQPQEEHMMSFGTDDLTKVTYNILNDEHEEAGRLIGNNVQKFRSVAKVESLHKNKVDVIVEQSMPVSRNDDLSITLTKGQTTPGFGENIENKKGLLQWSFALQSEEEKEIFLAYTLEWPKDRMLSGSYR